MERGAMRTIVGIDPGLQSAGIVRLLPKTGEIVHRKIGTKTNYGPIWDRYSYSVRKLHKFLLPNDRVLMEDYAFGVKPTKSRLATMGEIGGLFKMTAYQKTGRWPLPVNIFKIKKFLCGTGNGKMEDLKLALYKKTGLEFPTGDEVIAFGVAQIGLCALGAPPIPRRRRGWYKYEIEVASDLRKNWHKNGFLF